ncbi:MAG: hypothetical protein WD059_05580 [Balneolaceae bacterium]
MTFLKPFWKKLKNLAPNFKSQSAVELSNDLGRYLTSSGWFARTKSRVKPNAFMPAPDSQLSVFNIENLEEKEIKRISEKYVLPKRPQINIHGYAKNLAKDFKKAKLSIIKAEPPPKHINIGNWPESKDEQMIIAQELAEKATLNIFDTKISN